MRIIDLSVALKNGIVSEPPHMAQSITYSDHAAGAKEFMEIFPGVPTQNSESQRNPGVSPAFRVLGRDRCQRQFLTNIPPGPLNTARSLAWR
jgi:hypothetical protein